MMTSSERVLTALNHKEPDRVPYTDNPWFTTLERWKKEGFPDNVAPSDYFEFEFAGFGFDSTLMLPEEIIEENENYIIAKNKNGAITKNFKHETSTPELIGFTLNSPEKWYENKHLLEFKTERVNLNNDKILYDKAKKEGKFVHVAFAMGYDELSSTVGPETLLPAMLTEPEWVYDMFKTFMDLKIACVEEMLHQGYEFDGAFVFDDLGYKNGTFFSPSVYKNLLYPHHKKICDFLHSKGWKVILHSCGNVNTHIPNLISAGFDCLQPLEVKAGMDLIKLKKQYGDILSFMGGIDVRKMASPSDEVIEDEIKTKFESAKKGGGYIFHSDHSIPDDVGLKRYEYIINLVLKYGKY